MKLKFLGTAAYEGIPALFCNCDVCRKSRELGGRNMRSRSQALVDEDLLLDFPADTLWHTHRFGLDWQKIRYCLITHDHSDHLYPEDAIQADPAFTHGHNGLHFYSAQAGYDHLNNKLGDSTKKLIKISLVEAGKKFTAGDYEVLPLWADHDSSSSPVFYSIRKGNKKLLYAHDTGWFPDASWDLLKKEGGVFDLISLDCTGGLVGGGWTRGHMGLETNLKVIERLRDEKLIDDKTVIVANHFTHNANTYDELIVEGKKHGVIISYDGMEMDF